MHSSGRVNFEKAILRGWSSHPMSLKRQRKWMFLIAMSPFLIFLALAILAFSGHGAWGSVFNHPALWLVAIGGTLAFAIGATLTMSLMNLLGRVRAGRSFAESGKEIPGRWILFVLVFFWAVPFGLTFLQDVWGGPLVPGPFLLVLNLLCFLPMVALLAWARWSDETVKGERPRTRWFWLVLGGIVLAVVAFTLFGDLHAVLADTYLGPYLEKIKPALLRLLSVMGLVPLAMICFLAGLISRAPVQKTLPQTSGTAMPKGFWRRIVGWVKKFLHIGADAGDGDVESASRYPEWVDAFAKEVPDYVIWGTKEVGKPDRLTVSEYSEIDTSEAASPLWMLMGGEEERRPTKSQVKFFNRYQAAYQNAMAASEKGNLASADLILSGDEGSGRTETLVACALFSAFARRQRVMLVVQDDFQAKIVADKISVRVKRMLLDGFIFCDVLDRTKVINWVRGGARDDVAEQTWEPIPSILVTSPRTLEGGLFFNDVANDRVSLDRLRDVITMFEVVLVDDLMEMDATVRAHFTFVIHKMRLLLSQKRIIPQTVVVTPRVMIPEGVDEISGKLFGMTQFNQENAITLLPRKCADAWKIVLRTPPNLQPNELCQVLVRKCLEWKLDVVLYRKGVLPQQAEELCSAIKGELEDAKLSVVARLDEIDGASNPDAVFYLAAVSGGDGLSLRLNMGGSQSVFIGITSVETAEFECGRIIPVLPDKTAVALRIYHLKSVLRFITPGMPMDEAIWKHFGVSLFDRNIGVARRESDATPVESWFQDQWDEPERYGEPLWPYVVMESRATNSTAGFKIDFATLPVTRENVYRINGTNKIVLGTVGASDSEHEASGVTSMAKWVDGRRFIAGCDLAHVDRLIFGKSADGDITGSESKNVYTVRGFHAATEGYCMEIEPTRWEGDGSDRDIPVRTFSWNIEPVSVPHVTVNQSNLSFLAFSMPECRGILRTVHARITHLANSYGDESIVTPSRSYEYPVYVSALVFLPNRLDPADAVAQIQLASVGQWNTQTGEGFSLVLTHAFAGVMRRIVPDMSFFALCPAFHTAGRDGSIGAVTFWILQPANSGKTVNDVLVRFFGRASKKPVVHQLEGGNGAPDSVDAELIVQKMLEAVQKMALREKTSAIVRWLRSFSGSAFDFDLNAPGADERIREDLKRSEQVLKDLLRRIREPRELDVADVRPVPRNVSWIMSPRQVPENLVADVDWQKEDTLPLAPDIGRGDVLCTWNFAHRDFSVRFGFDPAEGKEAYLRFLDVYSRRRICGSALAEYGCNDPYRQFVSELHAELVREYDRQIKKKSDVSLAEFLLSFAQSAIDYIRDPEDRDSDWPRFPSETCALQGGDCEDTSILYMELLRAARIHNALLLVPEHAAVGVAVEMEKTVSGKRPVSYSWHGSDYIYAETACSKGHTRGLGEETNLIPSAESIPAEVVPTPVLEAVGRPSICILNAEWRPGNNIRITLTRPQGVESGDGNLIVACYLRNCKEAYAEPSAEDYACVGAARLPGFRQLEVRSAVLQLSCSAFSGSRYVDIFVRDAATGAVEGHFVGAVRIS